jgi:hypothetical protein
VSGNPSPFTGKILGTELDSINSSVYGAQGKMTPVYERNQKGKKPGLKIFAPS